MSFEPTIRAALLATPAITSIVGQRIYFVTAPQDAAPPFIVLRRVATDPTLSTDNGQPGSSELDNIRLEVGCYTRELVHGNNLVKLVRVSLESNRPTVCVLQDIIHDYNDLPNMFQIVAEFSCWHRDTVPS